MRFPKEFKRNGNHYYLTTSDKCVYILQWNSGQNKNFRVERAVKPFKSITIPGKGDEAMKLAIQTAYEVASQ